MPFGEASKSPATTDKALPTNQGNVAGPEVAAAASSFCLCRMTPSKLELTRDPETVPRVGLAPDPWELSDRKYAQDDGRIGGRWDDRLSQFRTTYPAESLFACLVEPFAKLSPSPGLDEIITAIDDPGDHASIHAE